MFSAKPPVNDAIICRTRRSFSFPVCGEISCARIFSRNEPHRESPPSVPETRHYFSGNRLETETCIIAVFLLDGSNTRFPSGAANISVAALIPAKFRFRRSIRLLVGPSSGASGFMPSFDRSLHAVSRASFFLVSVFFSRKYFEKLHSISFRILLYVRFSRCSENVSEYFSFEKRPANSSLL